MKENEQTNNEFIRSPITLHYSPHPTLPMVQLNSNLVNAPKARIVRQDGKEGKSIVDNLIKVDEELHKVQDQGEAAAVVCVR